jgi:cobalt-precorrin-5B (C1)-methyltransferase
MSETETDDLAPSGELRRGWTTGACATAAVKSALTALLGKDFADPVTITLPGGQSPAFALAHEMRGENWAEAGIIKDAGDDPDVTHGATIVARVAWGEAGSGITFHAGVGVGTVTRPGLPLAVGEPAINPVPRQMMTEAVEALARDAAVPPDFSVTISVPGGEKIAQQTWNPRLGILGGISILGTTGIVIPYSCSAWIHSIHRGIDVARAMGLTHVCGATGDRSEKAARARLGLPGEAYLDMGDFVGGMLKYLRTNPVEQVTIAGGFAKLTKLAQGALDLHSARSTVDLDGLASIALALGGHANLAATIRQANTASEALALAGAAGLDLAGAVASAAQEKALGVLRGAETRVQVLVTDRSGTIVAEAG